jgi:hypothetical protein
MRTKWNRRQPVLAVVGLVAALPLALVSAGAAGPTAKMQRISIEEHSGSQTFVLTPLTPGPIEADSGAVTFAGGFRSKGLRDGQFFRKYGGLETFQGKRGILRVPNAITTTDAGGGYQTGTGTWSISGGTGPYAGLRGGGRQSAVGTPKGTGFTRYEGYVSTG